jgi:FabA-like domain
MPTTLLIEGMAQTGALCMHNLNVKEPPLIYFMSIDKARLRQPVRPGEVVYYRVEKVRSRGPVWRYRGQAIVLAAKNARPFGVPRPCRLPPIKSCNQCWLHVRRLQTYLGADGSAYDFLAILDHERFCVRSVPVGERIGFAHVGWEWIAFASANDRLHNAPYRLLIIGRRKPHKHDPTSCRIRT